MKRTLTAPMLFTFAILIAAPLNAQGPSDGLDIIEHHIAARGGRDRLVAVRSIRMVGSHVSTDSTEPFIGLWKHPAKLRVEMGRGDSSMIYAYDGVTAWTLESAPWGREPARMTPTQKDILMRESDFAGPFVNASAKGLEIRYQGINRDEGIASHVFDLVATDGRMRRFFLDTATFLVRKESYIAGPADFSYQLETRFGDYRMVNGIAFPRSRERYFEGAFYSRVVIDSIMLDVPVADSEFAMPAFSDAGDTAAVIDIDRILVLRDLFRRDSGYVRLVALMSPT